MAHHDRNGRSTILRSHVVQRRSIAPEPRFRTAQNRPRDRVELGIKATCVKTTVDTGPTKIVVGPISESLKTHRSSHQIPRKDQWGGDRKSGPIG